MINMMRVDERLIHGQVAVVWAKHLGVNRIIVANDEVVKNEMQMMALKMAIPSNIKANVKNVDDAIKILNDPRGEKLKIFVVVGSPKDAFRVAESVKGINLINIGNYGRMEQPSASGKKREKLDDTVYVTEEDKKYLRLLAKYDGKVNVQVVPTETEKLLKNIIK
ncbi:hypothetical protein LF65_05513 [Clostridium beijerinckii]|uniref:PTS EIIB type-4 domain-containing protein n=1 Tax=Clostridium beijerinckii TaxID=1520 RepID=A0A0B5QYE2_CLOBE|nr:PTS sugar transporter subunit IIB [Clostridium beijerinckii]AJH02024.1 hypothetical protein LF65_05513 [Clostridium beijerinckii]